MEIRDMQIRIRLIDAEDFQNVVECDENYLHPEHSLVPRSRPGLGFKSCD